jgi:hypothetical protein
MLRRVANTTILRLALVRVRRVTISLGLEASAREFAPLRASHQAKGPRNFERKAFRREYANCEKVCILQIRDT